MQFYLLYNFVKTAAAEPRTISSLHWVPQKQLTMGAGKARLHRAGVCKSGCVPRHCQMEAPPQLEITMRNVRAKSACTTIFMNYWRLRILGFSIPCLYNVHDRIGSFPGGFPVQPGPRPIDWSTGRRYKYYYSQWFTHAQEHYTHRCTSQ